MCVFLCNILWLTLTVLAVASATDWLLPLPSPSHVGPHLSQASLFQDIDALQSHGIVRVHQGLLVVSLCAFRPVVLSVLFLYFLSTPAQNVADIKKLKSAGICTVKVCSTPTQFVQ